MPLARSRGDRASSDHRHGVCIDRHISNLVQDTSLCDSHLIPGRTSGSYDHLQEVPSHQHPTHGRTSTLTSQRLQAARFLRDETSWNDIYDGRYTQHMN
jgi:hypothetical protein